MLSPPMFAAVQPSPGGRRVFIPTWLLIVAHGVLGNTVRNRSNTLVAFLGVVALSAAASAGLQGCQQEDKSWRGVVMAYPMTWPSAYRAEKGTFTTFTDCERAMKANLAGERTEDPGPAKAPGFAWRTMFHQCVQGTSEIIIGISYSFVEKPK
jgi:hypothetical protein